MAIPEAGLAFMTTIRHGRMRVVIEAAATVIEGSVTAMGSQSEQAIGVVISVRM